MGSMHIESHHVTDIAVFSGKSAVAGIGLALMVVALLSILGIPQLFDYALKVAPWIGGIAGLVLGLLLGRERRVD